MKIMRLGLIVLVLIVVVSIAAGGSSKKKNTSTNASTTTTSCGFKASDSCTPVVSGSHRIRVDALVWHLAGPPAEASSLADGTTAHGRFLIVELGVHSVKTDSALVTSDVVKLVNGKRTYDADLAASEAAAANSSDNTDTLTALTLQPDDKRKVLVVFDVPASALHGHLRLLITELGFGSTKGFIKLAKPIHLS